MASNEIGARVKITGAGEFKKNLSTMTQATKTFKSEMKSLETTASKMTVGEKVAKQQSLLKGSIDATTAKLDIYKQKYDEAVRKEGEASRSAMYYRQKIAQTEAELGKLHDRLSQTNAFTEWGKRAQEAGQKIKSVGDSMQSIGGKMTRSITVPLVGLGAIAVKSASDWESAFTGVQKTVDATSDVYGKLEDGIKQMATETASSAVEIAGVMEVVGQLGVEVGKDGETILGFTRTMIQLGDATNLSAEEGATALAKFMNITGLTQDKASNLGSAIVDLGNNFATDEASIVAMSTRLASAGTLAGLTETDILALSAAMSSVGIEAEAGGTAMSQTLSKIGVAVDNFKNGNEEALNTIASVAQMSASDFATAWETSPITALEKFIGGLGTLDERGQSATIMLDEMGMSGIRQSNMLKSLALASDVLSDAVNTSANAFEENTALSNEATKRYATFASEVSQLKERAKNLSIEFGKQLLPSVKNLMDGVSKLLDRFSKLDDRTKQNIIKFAAFAAATGPVISTVGKVTSGVGAMVEGFGKVSTKIGEMPKLANGITSLTSVIGGLGSAVPIVTGAVIAGVAAWEIYKNSATGYANQMRAEQEEVRGQLDSTSARVDALIPRMEALQAKDSLTASEKQELANIVAYLNNNFADLNITIDAATGKIENYNDSLVTNIDKLKEQYKATKAQEELEKIWSKSAELEAENAEVMAELADVADDLAKVLGISADEFYTVGDSAEDLRKNVIDLMNTNTAYQNSCNHTVGVLDGMINTVDQNTKKIEANNAEEEKWIAYMGDSTTAIEENTEATEESTTAAAEAAEAYSDESEAVSEQAQAYADLQKKIWETTSSKREGFALMEQEKVSYDEVEKALQSQIDTYSNYTANLGVVQGYVNSLTGAERESAQALLDYTMSMGIDGASYVAMFADSVANGGNAVLEAAGLLAEGNAAANEYNNAMLSAQSGIDSYTGAVDGAASSTEGSNESMTSATEDMSDAVAKAYDDMATNAQKSVTRMNQALSNGMNTAKATVASKASQIPAGLNGLNTAFYNQGVNAAQGLANGINARAPAAVAAARSMAQQVAAASQHALDEHSPSRIFEWQGAMAVDGLVRGIVKRTQNAIAAARSTAQQVANASYRTLSDASMDLDSLYSTVRAGASDANVKIYLNDRELTRSLKGIGVAFA